MALLRLWLLDHLDRLEMDCNVNVVCERLSLLLNMIITFFYCTPLSTVERIEMKSEVVKKD